MPQPSLPVRIGLTCQDFFCCPHYWLLLACILLACLLKTQGHRHSFIKRSVHSILAVEFSIFLQTAKMLRLALSGDLLRSSVSREQLPLVVILHDSSKKRLTVLKDINEALEQRNGHDVVEADLQPASPDSAGAAVTQPRKSSGCCTCDRVIPPLSFRCLSMSGDTGIELAFSLSPCRRLMVGDKRV